MEETVRSVRESRGSERGGCLLSLTHASPFPLPRGPPSTDNPPISVSSLYYQISSAAPLLHVTGHQPLDCKKLQYSSTVAGVAGHPPPQPKR